MPSCRCSRATSGPAACQASGRASSLPANTGRPGTPYRSFTDTASHYTVLDGTVTASQDWTGYDPRLANSDGNFAR